MKYNELTLNSRNPHSRVGRGISAGQGKTAGRGTKGQGSRAGSTRRPGFAGGQTPLLQLIPKLRGFKPVKSKAEIVYTGQLNQFKGLVNNQILADAGILINPFGRAKIIVRGEVTTNAAVSLQSASLKAIAMIEKAGGSFTPIPRQGRPSKTKQNHSPD